MSGYHKMGDITSMTGVAIHKSTIGHGFRAIMMVILLLTAGASGCSQSKHSPPSDFKPATGEWTSHRGNAGNGVAASKLTPPFAQLWQFEADGPLRSSPVVSGGIVVISSQKGTIYGLSLADGKQAWKYRADDGIIASPAIADGSLYVASMRGTLYCLTVVDGKPCISNNKKLRGKLVAPLQTGDRQVMGNPAPAKGGAAITRDSIIIGANNKSLQSINRDDFDLRWSVDVSDWIEAVPVVDGGNVYFGSNDGRLYVVDEKTGAKKWSYLTERCVYSTPAIIGNMVIFTSWDGKVYARDKIDGERMWDTKIDDQISSSPAVYKNTIIAGGAYSGDLVSLDAETGKVLWRMPTHGGFDAGPVITGDYVIIGSYDTNLYAIDARTGSVAWKYESRAPIRSAAAVAGNVIISTDMRGRATAFVEAAK